MSISKLENLSQILVQQRKEMAELFGFETRNKYEVLSTDKESLLFIAENQKGVLGFLLRQYIGHWRSFDLEIFDSERKHIATAKHPFKFIFSELRLQNLLSNEEIGHTIKQFAILRKKFSIHLKNGESLVIDSGLFSPWTYEISRNGTKIASIKKRWSGGLKEIFTDADNFLIEFDDTSLDAEAKLLIVAVAVLIDLSYFERKN